MDYFLLSSKLKSFFFHESSYQSNHFSNILLAIILLYYNVFTCKNEQLFVVEIIYIGVCGSTHKIPSFTYHSKLLNCTAWQKYCIQ